MTPVKKTAPSPYAGLIDTTEAYLSKYLTYADSGYPFVLALWIVATYMWPEFDAFPYISITSDTKRSGKTLLSEVIGFASSNAEQLTAMTAAGIFRSLKENPATMIFDEAEAMSSEAAGDLRAVINTGYRKGGHVKRTGDKGKVEVFPTYCPKVFVLIGDVNDTFRDRSIIVRMVRGRSPERFLYESVKTEGNAIGGAIAEAVKELRKVIYDLYADPDLFDVLSFLNDRDAEIWSPLFAVCSAFCPNRIMELTASAADFATLKTAPKRKYTSVELQEAEANAQETEYAERLLVDLFRVMGDYKYLWTQDALNLLLALPTGPWRRLRGTGITDKNIADMLDRFGVKPVMIRSKGGRKHSKTLRGYRKEDVTAALRGLNFNGE